MKNLLLKKLQIKSNYIVNILNAPENAAAIFGDIPTDVYINFDDETKFNVLIFFSTSTAQLNSQIERSFKQIDSKTIIWAFYQKKSSKVKSDLDLMKSWRELGVYNLAPCGSASINETWTGLRLKLASEIKHSGLGNEQIANNAYGDYIDPINKTVKLPEDLLAVLSTQPSALAYFSQLAYSHRKEYVLWILTAKQEKTRLARIHNALNMLLNHKKNPSEKG